MVLPPDQAFLDLASGLPDDLRFVSGFLVSRELSLTFGLPDS